MSTFLPIYAQESSTGKKEVTPLLQHLKWEPLAERTARSMMLAWYKAGKKPHGHSLTKTFRLTPGAEINTRFRPDS